MRPFGSTVMKIGFLTHVNRPERYFKKVCLGRLESLPLILFPEPFRRTLGGRLDVASNAQENCVLLRTLKGIQRFRHIVRRLERLEFSGVISSV